MLLGEKKEVAEKKLFNLMEEENSSLKEIESLIEQEVDINCVNKEGITPLLYLLMQPNQTDNFIDVLQSLLHHGADIKTNDDNGYNALHYVCRQYQKDNLIETIRLFIYLYLYIYILYIIFIYIFIFIYIDKTQSRSQRKCKRRIDRPTFLVSKLSKRQLNRNYSTFD